MLVLYESRNSATSLIPMWSGMSPFVVSGIRLYADYADTYIVGNHEGVLGKYLSRFETATAGVYPRHDLTPPQDDPTNDRVGVMTHYYSELGFAIWSAFAWTSSGTHLYAQGYPEIADYPAAWQDYGALPRSPIDVVFPDTPDSPRFVFGFENDTPEKIYIVLCDTSGLFNRYATNWLPPLASGSAITDLECVRFI